MPDFALVENTVPRPLSPNEAVFVPAGGGQPDRHVPVGALAVWTEPQRNAISTYTIGKDTTPVPSNKKVDGRELRYDQPSNTVKWHDVWVDLPLDERKDMMRREVDGKRDSVTWAGYSHDFGASLGGVHKLQTRADDEIRWMQYRNACQEQIAAGNGGVIVPPSIRTEQNVMLSVRANQGMAAMVGMRARESAVLQHSWTFKEQIQTATSHAALDAIDINAGWPA